MKFSENLREMRKQRGFSQEYLAERLGVSRQTISKWENGTAMPDLKKLTQLADLFETNMDCLLGFSESAAAGAVMTEENIRYTEELVSAIVMNREERFYKHIKGLLMTAFAVAVALTVALLGVNASVRNTLQNQMNHLQSQVDMLGGQRGVSETEPEENENFYTEFISVDREKPWLLRMCLCYAPGEYAKGAAVSFEVNADGQSAPTVLKAENRDGVFTAEFTANATKQQYGVTVFVDDGERISRISDCYLDPVGEDFLGYSDYFNYNWYYEYSDKSLSFYTFPGIDDGDASAHELAVMPIYGENATEAYLCVEDVNGKTVARQKLEVSPYKGAREFHNAVTLQISAPKIKPENNPVIRYVYVILKDNLGVEYRYYAIDDRIGTEAKSPYGGSRVVIYTVNGEKKAVALE